VRPDTLLLTSPAKAPRHPHRDDGRNIATSHADLRWSAVKRTYGRPGRSDACATVVIRRRVYGATEQDRLRKMTSVTGDVDASGDDRQRVAARSREHSVRVFEPVWRHPSSLSNALIEVSTTFRSRGYLSYLEGTSRG
jgi:hypothetical protein